MLGLALIIELLADALGNLASDLGRVDRRLHAAMDRKKPLQLTQVGLDRRLHIGILQLARQRVSVMRPGAVDLAQ